MKLIQDELFSIFKSEHILRIVFQHNFSLDDNIKKKHKNRLQNKDTKNHMQKIKWKNLQIRMRNLLLSYT